MAAPKPRAGAPELDLSALPPTAAGVADRVLAFVAQFAPLPGGVRPWQADIIRGLYAHGARQAYIQMPRKNGKTALAARLALYHLLADDREDEPHVMAIGPTEEQAKIVWRAARRLVVQSSRLDAARGGSVLVYGRELLYPGNGGRFTFHTIAPAGAAGSAEERLQGYRPTFAVCDEVHVYPSGDAWDAILAGMATSAAPLLLGITTPGSDEASFAHDLYAQGKAGVDGLYFHAFEAPEGADPYAEATWSGCNPALGDFLHLDGVKAEAARMPEHAFRRYRLGQWTAVAEAWLPMGVWSGAAKARPVEPGERIYLGFDGSLARDSTALVACTQDGYVFVLGHWEPGNAGKVDRAAVHKAVDHAFRTYRVRSMWADPPYWWEELAEWRKRYGEERVLDVPTNSWRRMSQMCGDFYSGILEGRLTHDGHPALARHLANCVVKPTPGGDVITKETKDSKRRIDLAVAAVLAYAQAAQTKKRTVSAW